MRARAGRPGRRVARPGGLSRTLLAMKPTPESERKAATAAANADEGTYETTEHGRRRVSRLPKSLLGLWRLVTWPFRMIHHKFRRER